MSIRKMLVGALIALLFVPGIATAGEDTFSHNVTVQVDTVLSIVYEDDPNILMEFQDDFSEGSVSIGKFINYKVRANDMTEGALDNAITAKIDAEVDGVEIITADSSIQYTNEGTASNAVLIPVGAAPVVIGTTEAPIFKKESGPSAPGGKILKGRAGAYYQARALRDLAPGDGGSCVLTVTLRDV